MEVLWTCAFTVYDTRSSYFQQFSSIRCICVNMSLVLYGTVSLNSLSIRDSESLRSLSVKHYTKNEHLKMKNYT